MTSDRVRHPGPLRPGFSLTELMVAVVILAVGVLGMGGLMGANSRMQRVTTAQVDMVQLAERKLDELRAIENSGASNPTGLTIGQGSLTSDVTNYFESFTVSTSRKYKVRWQVETGLAGTKKLTVRVIPVDQADAPANLDMQTLL